MMAPMARAATTSDVFNAIAEQQRREILMLLRAGEGPVTEFAHELGMTQPGASTPAGYGRFTSGPAGSSGSGTRASTGWTSTCRASARTAGGAADERDGTRSACAVRDGGPRDRDLPGHRCSTGAGVRGVHRGAAPVAVVGAGWVHHHDTGVR